MPRDSSENETSSSEEEESSDSEESDSSHLDPESASSESDEPVAKKPKHSHGHERKHRKDHRHRGHKHKHRHQDHSEYKDRQNTEVRDKHKSIGLREKHTSRHSDKRERHRNRDSDIRERHKDGDVRERHRESVNNDTDLRIKKEPDEYDALQMVRHHVLEQSHDHGREHGRATRIKKEPVDTDRSKRKHREHRTTHEQEEVSHNSQIKEEPANHSDHGVDDRNKRREESHGRRMENLRQAEGHRPEPIQAQPAEVKKEKPAIEKEKPNMEVTGKLADEANMYNGVVVQYNEPKEACKPKRRWRFYIFKGDDVLPMLQIHRQSAYLLGRDRRVADIPVDHPSCSKQHAAFQYRMVKYQRDDGTTGRRVRPYIIDLESANGTFVNNKKISPRRYVELFEKDVIKFGFSSREYVLLHEESKGDEEDDYEQV